MAFIFQTFKSRVDSATGERVPVLDAKGQPVPHGRWRARIPMWDGKPKKVTLSAKTRGAAEKEADLLETRQREIKNGIRPVPTPADRAARRPFAEVAEEYLAWGEMQGGRKGKPWSEKHASDKRAFLAWWRDAMGLNLLADVDGCLPKAEKALREVEKTGRPDTRPGREGKVNRLSGKTLQSLADALKSFFQWCAVPTRRYLTSNPLDGMTPFDTTPVVRRRDMTLQEIQALLDAGTEWERLLMETALCSGLRKGELRALSDGHLDVGNATLLVDARRDKGGKERFQPIPEQLARALAKFAATGEPGRLYTQNANLRKKGSTDDIPDRPLLYVPGNAAAIVDRLAKRAGVPKYAPGGKIDFHALRTAYINQVIYSGADAKTAQELARHENPSLTMNTYGRARRERMAAAVKTIGAAVLDRPGRSDGAGVFSGASGTGAGECWTGLAREERPTEGQRLAAGAESLSPPIDCAESVIGELPQPQPPTAGPRQTAMPR